MSVVSILPFFSALLSFTFVGFVSARYVRKRGTHLLVWAIGLLFYGIGALCEALYSVMGWHPLLFRSWYLFGAILVAAWLGQGTVYLWLKRTVARVLMIILIAASLFAAYRVVSAELDPAMLTTSVHTGSELSGHAIVSSGVRVLTPFFNVYGTITLVGGAIYSAWLFFKKRVILNRAAGNVLIAAGALLPAFGGLFSRIGIASALYIGELAGVILIFCGYLLSVKGRGTAPIRH